MPEESLLDSLLFRVSLHMSLAKLYFCWETHCLQAAGSREKAFRHLGSLSCWVGKGGSLPPCPPYLYKSNSLRNMC